MNKNKILIIHNPKAGQKKKIKLKEELIKWSSHTELQFIPTYNYVETEYGGHATELAQKAVNDGYTCIAAAGGDGTVNEIATALVNTNAALGIIAMGSGNGLARHNEIPLDLEEAFYNLFTGKSKKIDVGIINDRYFFCAAGVGFDALVSERFANSKTRGLISYFLISLKEYFKYKSSSYQINTDDETIEREAFFITLANANQFGNHAYIAPQAKIDDGKLELCILKPFAWYNGFSLANRLFNKTIQKSKLYEAFSISKATLESEFNIPFHTDGEANINSTKQVSISIIPKALNIITH